MSCTIVGGAKRHVPLPKAVIHSRYHLGARSTRMLCNKWQKRSHSTCSRLDTSRSMDGPSPATARRGASHFVCPLAHTPLVPPRMQFQGKASSICRSLDAALFIANGT